MRVSIEDMNNSLFLSSVLQDGVVVIWGFKTSARLPAPAGRSSLKAWGSNHYAAGQELEEMLRSEKIILEG